MRRAVAALVSTLLVAACGDPPSQSATQPAERAPSSPESFGMKIMPPPVMGGAPLFAMVPDPGDPNTITYTFDDLPYNCEYDAVTPDPYDDLDFTTTPYLAACFTPNGTMGVIPSNSHGFTYTDALYEVRIQLPNPASSVSLDSWGYTGSPPGSIIGYDASGTAIASATFTNGSNYYSGGVENKTMAAAGIRQVGLSFYQNSSYLDNLKIRYVKDPTHKDDCKDGGWAQYGFKNQGQCVRFVETGKDSRVP